MPQQVITLTLVVKEDSPEAALKVVENKLLTVLNLWYTEDLGAPPYPNGALLLYTFNSKNDQVVNS